MARTKPSALKLYEQGITFLIKKGTDFLVGRWKPFRDDVRLCLVLAKSLGPPLVLGVPSACLDIGPKSVFRDPIPMDNRQRRLSSWLV